MTSWLSSLWRLDDTTPPPPQSPSKQPFNDSRDTHDWYRNKHRPNYRIYKTTNSARLFDTMDSSPTSDLDRQLLPNMPSLFTYDLPPCGAEVQVAYQNVLHRLRCLWLQHAADDSSHLTPHDITKLVKNALDFETLSSPVGSLKGTKTRRPWRRESVFGWEMKWIGYFVREAEVMQRWPGMRKAERERMEFSQKMFLVPRELGFTVKRREGRDGVLELWEGWHEKKRADMRREDQGEEVDAEWEDGSMTGGDE